LKVEEKKKEGKRITQRPRVNGDSLRRGGRQEKEVYTDSTVFAGGTEAQRSPRPGK
jgi:hypothetical protein